MDSDAQRLGCAIRSFNGDESLIAVDPNPHRPGIAAHFAILNERATYIRLNEQFDVFASIGTRHRIVIVHIAILRSGGERGHLIMHLCCFRSALDAV